MEAGDPTGALELMKLNTELHPEDANLWDTLGEGHLALGQPEAAAAAFGKVLEVMPTWTGRRESREGGIELNLRCKISGIGSS